MDSHILKKIKEAINTEEFVVPIYIKHLQSAVFWSGFQKEKQKIIIKNLKILSEDSKFHTKALEKIKSIYLKKT